MNTGGPSSQELAELVLGYLRRHPEAADTLDGIVTWWLPLQRYETERGRVERVLDVLVADGFLRRDRLPDGSDLYALEPTADSGTGAIRKH